MKKHSKKMQQHESVMEIGDHFKNEASPKSLMSRGNIKSFTLLAFIVLFGFRAVAQDVIVLKNGDEIKSIVQEVGVQYVKYKKFDNQTGPIYNVAISEIFMIKYTNGSKDVFNEPVKQQDTKTEQSVQQSIKEDKKESQNPSKLSFIYGKVFFNGKSITDEQVKNILSSNDLITNSKACDIYRSGSSRVSLGGSLIWCGLAYLCIGSVLYIIDMAAYQSNNASLEGLSYTLYELGAVGALIGWPIYHSGNNRIKKAIDIYNTSINSKHQSDLSLNFGITQSGGLGLTLNF